MVFVLNKKGPMDLYITLGPIRKHYDTMSSCEFLCTLFPGKVIGHELPATTLHMVQGRCMTALAPLAK